MWGCSPGAPYPSSSARNSASVMTRTSLFGSSFLSVLTRSSGAVVLVKAIVFPSGDQAAGPAPFGRSVSCCASPPASARRYSWVWPSLGRRKASVEPSGDQRGAASCGPLVMRRGGESPSVATSQRLVSLPPRFAFPAASTCPALPPDPEARLVAFVLRVHGDQHVRRPPPVGRDLRARHPAEREQVAIRDGALLRREPGRAHQRGQRDHAGGAHDQ